MSQGRGAPVCNTASLFLALVVPSAAPPDGFQRCRLLCGTTMPAKASHGCASFARSRRLAAPETIHRGSCTSRLFFPLVCQCFVSTAFAKAGEHPMLGGSTAGGQEGERRHGRRGRGPGVPLPPCALSVALPACSRRSAASTRCRPSRRPCVCASWFGSPRMGSVSQSDLTGEIPERDVCVFTSGVADVRG